MTINKSKKITHILNNSIIIYNGNKWILKKIQWWHFGHTFGELIETRKPFYFFSKKKKNKRLLRR